MEQLTITRENLAELDAIFNTAGIIDTPRDAVAVTS